uniref:Uncharacterized protein n=1 Tax=Theileria annulata TaxID=5874 RepID=A0A3B0MUM0_THEAN
MVLQKLVNSTNVVFHMLDLQPYAMVLPMDKHTSDKNKLKIFSKILKNNPDTYSIYKSHNIQFSNINTNTTGTMSNGVTDVTNSTGITTTTGPIGTRFESQFNNTLNNEEDIDISNDMEKNVKLEHLKIKQTTNSGDVENIFMGVKRFLDRLDSENIIGCMIILAQKSSERTSISPIAGGIVEVFDDYERSIQTLWLNNNISNYVNFINLKGKKNARKLITNLDDQILSKIVLSTLTLRLCAHAYQMTLPNSKRIQHKSRLISIYHQMGQTFPHFAYNFIKEEMQFSKHYEINHLSIKHNDNPKIPCRCLKPIYDNFDGMNQMIGTTINIETDLNSFGNDNLLFFGITESRFTGMYNSTYENILIGFMNLLSGKLSDISKIERFETLNYYEEEDDYKTKRHKVNFRSKRLQNRI